MARKVTCLKRLAAVAERWEIGHNIQKHLVPVGDLKEENKAGDVDSAEDGEDFQEQVDRN